MKPKQIRANMFFLSAQYKKNKQGRAIAGTEDVLDAGVEAMLDLEKRCTHLQQIIARQRNYARHLHAEYQWCKDTLIKAGLYNRKSMRDFASIQQEETKIDEQV